MSSKIKIAQISDLHFSKICYSPLQFFSKKWLGNAHLLLKRGRQHRKNKAFSLIDALVKEGVTDVLICGDLTTTSQHSEYSVAQSFIEELKKRGLNVILVPGNHDHYTKRSYQKQLFHTYFPEDYPATNRLPSSLKENKVSALQMRNGWWVVSLDTTARRSMWESNGVYTDEIDSELKACLDHIPPSDKIIVMNHFPFTQHLSKKHCLVGGENLEKRLAQYPNILFYLHGHTHFRCLADLRPSGLPIVSDCGSASHAANGSWSLIELDRDRATVSTFVSDQRHAVDWTCIEKASFDYVV